MTTPTAKPLPLTAQATLAHYQREAEHAADLAELKRAQARIAELEVALRNLLRAVDGCNVLPGHPYSDICDTTIAFAREVLAASKEN